MKKVIHIVCILAMLALTIAGCAKEGVSFTTPESTSVPSPAPEAPPAPELLPEEDTTSHEPEPVTIPVPTAESGLGTLQILATDPPEPDYTSIEVTIESIEVHKVVPGEPAQWMDIPLGVSTFDLLSLVGVTETLGSVETEAGRFTQIRIYVESVIVNGEAATVPSGVIRVVRPFKVGEGLITTLELDFDGQNSVITTGRGSYIFKPVIHLRTEVSSPAGIGEDSTPPEIMITGVTEGQVIVSPDTVTPEFNATDDIDSDPTVVATLNGEVFTSGTIVSEVGEYELAVTAVDASDNEAEIAINFEIVEVKDSTPPEITITRVTEGQVIISPDTVAPEFSATDDIDPEPTVVATLNGEVFTSGTVVSEAGEYQLVVTAIDASNNEAEEEINFEINDPPVANNDSATTSEDTPVDIDVTANDTDADGTIDPTTVLITLSPSNGSTTVNPSKGVVTYTPNANFTGSDSFNYTVKDDDSTTSNEATVTVTVT